MANYTITGYYSTGFNVQNIPSSPAVLQTAESRTFSSSWLWQNKDLATVRINSSWGDVADIDYLSIGEQYYIVTGCEMLSSGTASLTLQPDYITSAGGIGAVSITDGWVKRAHTSNDGLFENVAAEPWGPTEDLIIDGQQTLVREVYSPIEFVCATVDLSETEKTAEEYVDGSDNIVVYVPKIPTIESGSTYGMILPGDDPLSPHTTELPNTQAFRLNNDITQAGLQSARSLGIDAAIVACYSVPYDFISRHTYTPLNGKATDIIGVNRSYQATSTPFRYTVAGYTPRNNKVFAMYNHLYIMSICSGDAVDFEAFEIYGGGLYPAFSLYSDPQPDGLPYLQPTYYGGGRNDVPFLNSCKGMPWRNTPFSFEQASGNLINQVNYSRGLNRSWVNFGLDTTQAGLNVASKVANTANADVLGLFGNGNAVSRGLEAAQEGVALAQTTYNSLADIRETAADYHTAQNIRVPELIFPRSSSVQDYVGNNFFIYRVRISDNDVRRLDRFLTMYGYAQDKPLETSDFTSRQYFNYVQANSVNVAGPVGLRHRNGISAQLQNGVRLWHVLPDASYYNNNPIR